MRRYMLGLLFIFLVIFPKGGFKVKELPITWGYLLLVPIGFYAALRRAFFIERLQLQAFLMIVPFQVVAICTVLVNGFINKADLLSYLLHFIAFPVLFFLIFPQYYKMNFDSICFWIRKGVFFVASYGIFLFFYKVMTGRFIEIPFLTVNYHDMHSLELDKCIDRGGFFKLISTYNNGNLYGICILMLLPLYSFLERSIYKIAIVKISLLMTLSRTIWVGLFFYECLMFFRYSRRRVIKFLTSLLFLGGIFFVLSQWHSLSWEFIFDRFLGHRIGQFEVLKDIEWFSTKPFSGVYEIIYLGVLHSFGIVGVMTFLLAMSFPLFLYVFSQQRSQLSSAAALGAFLYLIIGCADGALLLLPVMCFYWFLSSFMLSDQFLINNSYSFVKLVKD